MNYPENNYPKLFQKYLDYEENDVNNQELPLEDTEHENNPFGRGI